MIAARQDLVRRAVAFAVVVAAWLLVAVPGALAQDFPPLTGRVVDQAQLLSPAREAEISARLEALERDTTDQLVVVTVADLQGYEIADYGYRLGRAWGIGQKDADNGVLLIVAPNERKVRIEVGYGLEGVLTDALSALIIQERILPPFREGGFERGILNGVDAIDEQLRLDPAEAQARAAAAATRPVPSKLPFGVVLVIGAIFLVIFLSVVGSAARSRRHGRRDGLSPILIWIAAEALKGAASGGRGGGGWRGGGGFGGGGGGFGGGGASGGW